MGRVDLRSTAKRARATGAAVFCVLCGLGCETDTGLRLPSRESEAFDPAGYSLLARIAHISDTHVIDEESPARFPGAQVVIRSAWRPYEIYSTQIFDGILRQVNRIHASGRNVDFVVHTGDACDNSQLNELQWLIGVWDGKVIDPRSGPDDRQSSSMPPAEMDPHSPFQAQGLYREGVHGDGPSVPWYVVFGNHDRFAMGVFPIVPALLGGWYAPLPLQPRLGIVLPVILDPIGSWAYGNVTPALSGLPQVFQFGRYVPPNPDRRYFDRHEFMQAMFDTVTGPRGHGFTDAQAGPTWYSVSPAPGLRLIGLDTCDPPVAWWGFPHHDGAMTQTQVDFLRQELAAAAALDELVVVASHHPSTYLQEIYGSALVASSFQSLLNEHPNVILHLAGHSHRNKVSDRGGYLEIETSSTIDLPQEGRIVEIWRREADGEVMIAYKTFSHVDDGLPALGADPLRAMRVLALETAGGDPEAAARQKMYDPTGAPAIGSAKDRQGLAVLRAVR